MTDRLDPDGSAATKSWTRRLLLVCRDWGLSLLVVAVLFHLIGGWRAPDLPDDAPGFVLKDLDGNSVALDDFQGRPVVLNFWATWCGPCQIEIPSFSNFADQNPDVVVLGVAMDGTPEELTRAAKEMGIRYPVVLANSEIKEAYGVSTLPTTVIIDPKGEVHSAYTGILFGPQLQWETRHW